MPLTYKIYYHEEYEVKEESKSRKSNNFTL